MSPEGFTNSIGIGHWYPMEDVLSSLVDRVMVIMDTCLVVSIGRRPSSLGSHVSVMSVDPIDVF